MSKSKKLFLALTIAFFVIMILIGWDISRRTTFPGSKPHLKEEIVPNDSK